MVSTFAALRCAGTMRRSLQDRRFNSAAPTLQRCWKAWSDAEASSVARADAHHRWRLRRHPRHEIDGTGEAAPACYGTEQSGRRALRIAREPPGVKGKLRQVAFQMAAKGRE